MNTLYNPQAPDWTPPLGIALDVGRDILVRHQGADINDDPAMLTAAVCLEIVLRHVLDAYAEADR